jgi:hypothetical protein
MENKYTKSKILTSLFWKLMERGGTQGIQFIVQIVLARLLIPEDFDLSGDNLANLKEKINVFVDEMVDIYQQHKVEFNILMMHSEVNDNIVNWCANLTKYLLVGRNSIKEFGEEASVLAQSYAVGLFSGLKEIFAISELDTDRMKKVTKLYLESCLSLFQFDIRKSLGD